MRYVISAIIDWFIELYDLYLQTKENWKLRKRSPKEETLSDWEKEYFE